MRHRKVTFIATVLRVARSFPLTRERVLFLAIVIAGVWMAWSLIQQAMLTHQLSHDAAQARQQNAALQTSNQNYRRDIAAATSGASAEEDVRLHGYARPGEQVYLVANQQPAQPTGTSPSGGASTASSRSPFQRLVGWITGH